MKRKLLIYFMTSLFVFMQTITSLAITLDNTKIFEVKKLPYAYDALQPYIDKETMIVHHDKHYQAYIDKLNAAISKYPELQDYSLTDLLTNLDSLPKDIALTVKNNAGGAYNHEFFFDIMNPQSSMPKDELFKAIERDFGSYETFRDSFKKAASEVFGSGFAWLVSNSDGCLSIITTPNQDTPISSNLAPIIGLDVWEHAYYLKYQNMRSTYIDNWFKIINWDKALENYENITK